jgi:hypothetical protein
MAFFIVTAVKTSNLTNCVQALRFSIFTFSSTKLNLELMTAVHYELWHRLHVLTILASVCLLVARTVICIFMNTPNRKDFHVAVDYGMNVGVEMMTVNGGGVLYSSHR